MAIAFGASLGTPVWDTENSLTTIALTTNVTVPSNSFLLFGVSWYNAAITASMSGSSLTYAKDIQKNGVADTNRHLAIFSAQAPSGLASGATPTATFSGGSFGRAIWGVYFTGVATSSPVDQSNTNAGSAVGSSTLWTPGSITTTNANDVLVVVSWNDGHTASDVPTSPNVEAIDFNNSLNAGWTMIYRIVAATGTYNSGGTWTDASGDEWTAGQVAYKAAAGGGGGTTVKQLAALGVG